MKKILILLVLSFLLFSCQKNYLIPRVEVPKWLKEKISKDEAIIKSDPKWMQSYGAWIMYEYQGEKYYEYDNPLSSTSRNPYSRVGVRINTTIAPFIDYWDDKCCDKFVWKGPKYHEF